MSRAPLKIGDVIDFTPAGEASSVSGEVVTFRLVEGRRQFVNLKTDRGSCTLVIDLTAPEGSPGRVLSPVDIDAARGVALSMMAGINTRLPVAAEANLLAAAVVALTGGAA